MIIHKPTLNLSVSTRICQRETGNLCLKEVSRIIRLVFSPPGATDALCTTIMRPTAEKSFKMTSQNQPI